MNSNEALDRIEQLLLRTLSPIERFIFQQSWLGRNYHDMAQDCSYGTTYIKEVGSQLWQDLSKAVGERVTKKNLQLVLGHHGWLREVLPVAAASLELQPPSETLSHAAIEFPSGPLPIDSLLYIKRSPTEDLALSEISQPGCALQIRGARKTGKSSLLARILAHAKAEGCRSICIDLQEADAAVFGSIDRFLRWFCINVSRHLELEPSLQPYWNEHMGSKVSCKVYFETYLLQQIQSPIVLAINEVNRIFTYPSLAADFLSMLRFWHELAKQSTPWRSLRLVTVQTTEIYSPAHSTFDVGLSLTLPPLTLEQSQALAAQYGLVWLADTPELQPLQQLLGGHPYLTNLAFYHLHRSTLSLPQLLDTALAHQGIYGSYLQEQLAILQQHPVLALALKQVVETGQARLEPTIAYQLESMGLVQLDGTLAQPSCELYKLYFQKHLSDLASDRELLAGAIN